MEKNVDLKSCLVRLAILLVFFLLSDSVYARKDPTFSKSIQFKERVFDFGDIKEEDGVVSHEFVFENAGTEMVHINGISTGCGCVHYDFSKEPVRPRAFGKVKIGYNPAYRPGFFSKEVVVLSNNNANYNRIWIKGTVLPCKHPVSENYPYEYGEGLYMNFEIMTFGSIGKDKKKMMKLKFANDTDKDMRLMFVVVGGNTDIRFTAPCVLKAHEEAEMPVTYQYSGRFPTETRVYAVVDGKALMKPLKVTCVKDAD